MIARKAMKLAESLVAAAVQRLLPRERKPAGEITVDPAASARIRAYIARSMKERYGEHGPP